VTHDPRHSDPGHRPHHRPGPGEAGRHPGGSAAGGAGSERIVIRDKRKINVSDGKQTTGGAAHPAAADKTATESPAQAGAEVVNEEATVVEAQPGGSTALDRSDDADADLVIIEPHGGEAVALDEELVIETDSVPTALGAELESLRSALDERTTDLQRLSAEFANYRRRVERDRAQTVEQATGNVLATLLPVLDDLDRARDHGDLVGPFGAVAEQLTATLTKFGLTPFGSKGEPFDPTRHEAVAHTTSADVTESTCVDVMRRGYLLGERLLRPALVAVADPE
jgi:molecular chaperone GrpE